MQQSLGAPECEHSPRAGSRSPSVRSSRAQPSRAPNHTHREYRHAASGVSASVQSLSDLDAAAEEAVAIHRRAPHRPMRMERSSRNSPRRYAKPARAHHDREGRASDVDSAEDSIELLVPPSGEVRARFSGQGCFAREARKRAVEAVGLLTQAPEAIPQQHVAVAYTGSARGHGSGASSAGAASSAPGSSEIRAFSPVNPDCDGIELVTRAPVGLLLHNAAGLTRFELLTLPWSVVRKHKVHLSALFLNTDEFYDGFGSVKSTLKPSTHREYYRALEEARKCLPVESLWFYNLDAAFFCVVESMRKEEDRGSMLQTMTKALCCIVHRVPSMKENFKQSRRALDGWRRDKDTKHAAAITRRMLIAFCGAMIARRREAEAACTAVAWGALLRAGEALALQAGDIVPPGDPRLASYRPGSCGILIKRAKTGRDQVAVIEDERIARIAGEAARGARGSGQARVFKCNFATLLKAIHKAAEDNGFNAKDFTTHSCRHGGAVHLHQRGTPVKDIMVRGRWKSVNTLQSYLNAANKAILKLEISSTSADRMAYYGGVFNSRYRESGDGGAVVVHERKRRRTVKQEKKE